MNEQPHFILDGQSFALPRIEGTEGEKAIDIQRLRFHSNYKVHDPGYANTSSCLSSLTFVDGERGILRHRGYAIEDLAAKASFLELAYALIYEDLPCQSALKAFEDSLWAESFLDPKLEALAAILPNQASALGMFYTLMGSLGAFYTDLLKLPDKNDADAIDRIGLSLLAKVASIAALVYRLKNNIHKPVCTEEPIYTKRLLCSLLNGKSPSAEALASMTRALDTFLLLHADHEQNCSTATVRMIASSGGSLLGAICGGISALSGPLHGGANTRVIHMLEAILASEDDGAHFIQNTKKGEAKLMGFGHRVYKNHDPRALLLKQLAKDLLFTLNIQDPLLAIAKNLETKVLKDPYFIERKLYPNLDFYSGILLRALNIPLDMFTILFVIGRTSGWIAHYKELVLAQNSPLYRPRQIYVGPPSRPFLSLNARQTH